MTGYRHLFGPVPSRRFGRSLGVDLLARKICTFDCIFCQLGKTTEKTVKRKEYVDTVEVIAELDHWLKGGGTADYIALAGSGEPTLHSRFGDVLDFIAKSTKIPSALLTNSSLLHLPEVRQAALRAKVVKASLSAWDESSLRHINRPETSLSLDRIVGGLRSFRSEFEGELWIEVFLVRGANTNEPDVSAIAGLVGSIGPDRIHLNTSVRPPSERYASAVPPSDMDRLAGMFEPRAETIGEFMPGMTGTTPGDIPAMIARHPCTAEQVARAFGIRRNEADRHLGKLTGEGIIHRENVNGEVYYVSGRKSNAPDTSDSPQG